MTEKEWKDTDKKLAWLAWSVCAVVGLAAALGEAEVLPSGILPMIYALQAGECLLTLLCMPLALRWMTLHRVRTRASASPCGYFSHSAARLAMLALPAIAGVVLYYLMADPSMGYCALIAILVLVYVWPSEGRRIRETHTDKEEEV